MGTEERRGEVWGGREMEEGEKKGVVGRVGRVEGGGWEMGVGEGRKGEG